MSELVYLGIGSNIGDRETNIFSAIAALDVREEVLVVRTASVYETDPLYNLPTKLPDSDYKGFNISILLQK